jgi:hypothetical protein
VDFNANKTVNFHFTRKNKHFPEIQFGHFTIRLGRGRKKNIHRKKQKKTKPKFKENTAQNDTNIATIRNYPLGGLSYVEETCNTHALDNGGQIQRSYFVYIEMTAISVDLVWN